MNTPHGSPPERPENVTDAQINCAPALIGKHPQALSHNPEPTSATAPSSSRKRVAVSSISAPNGPPATKRQRGSGPHPSMTRNRCGIPELTAKLQRLEILKGKTRAGMDACQAVADEDKALYAEFNLFEDENSSSDCEEESSTEVESERIATQEVGTIAADDGERVEQKALERQVVKKEQEIKALVRRWYRLLDRDERWGVKKRACLDKIKKRHPRLCSEGESKPRQPVALTGTCKRRELDAALRQLEEAAAGNRLLLIREAT